MDARKTIVLSMVCVGSLMAAGQAYGQGVGNLAALPSLIPSDPDVTGWFIGTYGVVRDPAGPKWIKGLAGPNGGPFTAAPGQTFSLTESLFIEGNLSWEDWHEEILTPGWEWVDPIGFYANGAPAPGLQVANMPGDPTRGGSLWFDFDPLVPGTKIDIRKQLQYVGGADGTAFDGIVRVAEYPTPEPASMVFLGLGSLLALRRRRDRFPFPRII